MNAPSRRAAALLLAALCIAVLPLPAAACTVDASYRWPTLEDRTRAADAVVLGRVERVHSAFWTWLFALAPERAADIAVDAWLKGDGPERIAVSGFGYNGDCRSTLPEGAAILFLVGDAAGGSLAISESGIPEAVIEYSPETARLIRAAAD